jgi:putative phosphoesterase
MTTRIGLISDPHATPQPLAEALAIFRREGVSQVLCAGDIGGYGEQLDETVALLQAGNVLAVRGNHEQWALQQEEFPGSAASRAYFTSLPDFLALTIEGVRLYMVHAEPPDRVMKGLRLFDPAGAVIPGVVAEWRQRLRGFDYDILILGHTHQVYAERLADTLVINPGSCCYNHSCAVLTLPQMELEWFALSGKPIDKLWNWGVNQVRG